MHSESDASFATFEQGLAAMEQDGSSDEYELVDVEESSEEEVDDINPYKRFKSSESSLRQAERRPYGNEAIKQEKITSSKGCQFILALVTCMAEEQKDVIDELNDRMAQMKVVLYEQGLAPQIIELFNTYTSQWKKRKAPLQTSMIKLEKYLKAQVKSLPFAEIAEEESE